VRNALRAGATVLCCGLAAAQEPDGTQNGAFVNASPQGAQLLAAARRAAATLPPHDAAETYLVVAAELAALDPGALIAPAGDAPEVLPGAPEALRRQLAAEPAAVIAAWHQAAEPRAAVALAGAGRAREGLAAVARRFPVCPSAVIALGRLGDLHLEAGRLERARDCYRQARRHLAPGAPAPPALARESLAPSTEAPEGIDDATAGPALRPAGTAWLMPEAAEAPLARTPALAPSGIALADATAVRFAGRDGQGDFAMRWEWRDAAVAAQAEAAARIEKAARSWAEDDLPNRGRWFQRVPVPRADEAAHAPAVTVAGPHVVAVMGRAARAASALQPVWKHQQWRAARWGAAQRSAEAWDGALAGARHLVALRCGAERPELAWRVGGATGVPGLGPRSDFASAPLACGDDVLVGAFSTPGTELAVHLLRLDGTTGRVRSSTYLGSGPLEHVRGPASAMLRVPPAMGLALVHGQVVVATNVGLVAACDPETGDVRWLRRYPQSASRDGGDGRRVAPPLALRDAVAVAPWDADHWFAYDPTSGAERARWAVPDTAVLRPVAARADGTLVALQGPADGPAVRLVALVPGRAAPEPLAAAPAGAGWVAAVAHGAHAWCASVDGVDRVDLTSGAVERVHWFGRDRPADLACAAGVEGLAVATDRHVHWFRVGDAR
jgi:hypothetical protein